MRSPFAHTQIGSYAVHQVRDGWEILAPSDDPFAPAYWRVAVARSGQDQAAVVRQSYSQNRALRQKLRRHDAVFRRCARCGLSYWQRENEPQIFRNGRILSDRIERTT
jgi:hypothetical protein